MYSNNFKHVELKYISIHSNIIDLKGVQYFMNIAILSKYFDVPTYAKY